MEKQVMEKPRFVKSSLFAVTALSALFTYRLADEFRPSDENAHIKEVREKMESFVKHMPEERLYLQTDRPLYEPGDDVWFTVFIRDGASLKPSPVSDIVHVELVDPRGAVSRKLSLIARNGRAKGDFTIGEDQPGGQYRIRAYTSWMKNDGPEAAYTRSLTVQDVVLPGLKMKLDFARKAYGAGDAVIANVEVVTNENTVLRNTAFRYAVQVAGKNIIEKSGVTDAQGIAAIDFSLPRELKSADGLLNVMILHQGITESISRSIPIVLNKVRLQLFPEGGDLLSGTSSRVAFKAENEFGKPADVEGFVEDNNGNRITQFRSSHSGMGSFMLTPGPGVSYHARITKPADISETYVLPDALQRGFAMSVDNSQSGRLRVSVRSTEKDELSFIAQVRGRVLYHTALRMHDGTEEFVFSTADFPAGVAQLTLFDGNGIPRCERLAFVNRDRKVSLKIETDKEKYLPREKVRMTITARDDRGLPVPASLFMSVTNDQLLSFADDRSGNILSQLLLEQDLRTTVEEPSFYFKKDDAGSAQALDHLLMTSGWRRFTWEKLLGEGLPSISFQPEKAVFAGLVLNGADGTVLKNAVLRFPGGQVTADQQGKFMIKGLDLSAPVTVTASAENFATQLVPVYAYSEFQNISLYKSDFRQYEFSVKSGHANRHIPEAAVALNDMEGVVLEEVAMNKSHGRAKKAKAEAPERKQAEVAAKRVLHRRPVARLAEHAPANVYYRSRQFAAPSYSQNTAAPALRTDFRNTVFWEPALEIGYTGRKTVEFYTSDDITSFRAVCEGIVMSGEPVRAEKVVFSQLPFNVKTRIPAQLIHQDVIQVPVNLTNNTNGPLGGVLSVSVPSMLVPMGTHDSIYTLMPHASKTVWMSYSVTGHGSGEVHVLYKSCALSDGASFPVTVQPRGFPVQRSFSAQDKDREFSIDLSEIVDGSLDVSFTAYPSVVADLLKGVEGILQEPYGCFEQTSCTAYPNALVLDYLRATESRDARLLARAGELLDRGYRRLTTFETPGKGYEWFGASPAHEGLTSYGIMEFFDMKRAGQQVDEQMLNRTISWLLEHRDGNGGFKREKRALHDFGRISDEVLNGYIVYSLAEAGCRGFENEFRTAYDRAMSSGDAYLLAMAANAAFSMHETAKGDAAMKKLLVMQRKDGSFNGSSHSITYSQGSALEIETSALALMAMMRSSDPPASPIRSVVQFIVSSRSGSGTFSSTQATILALKSLTQYAKFSRRVAEDGTIVILVDDQKVSEHKYRAGDAGAITVIDLQRHISGKGEHKIRVRFTGTKEALPYSISVNWRTALPQSQPECKVDVTADMPKRNVRVGETVRLNVQIANRSDADIPSAMVVVGIPAGLSLQAWQLKELGEKGLFDYYEIKDGNLMLYYRGMAVKDVKSISLDLRAEVAGKFASPATSGYLYYTNEYKTWCNAGVVSIEK